MFWEFFWYWLAYQGIVIVLGGIVGYIYKFQKQESYRGQYKMFGLLETLGWLLLLAMLLASGYVAVTT